MKIKVTLDNGGGELDSLQVDRHDDDDDEAVSERIHEAIAPWQLRAGDTITIREVG